MFLAEEMMRQKKNGPPNPIKCRTERQIAISLHFNITGPVAIPIQRRFVISPRTKAKNEPVFSEDVVL
jgi:hypothetical protein